MRPIHYSRHIVSHLGDKLVIHLGKKIYRVLTLILVAPLTDFSKELDILLTLVEDRPGLNWQLGAAVRGCF